MRHLCKSLYNTTQCSTSLSLVCGFEIHEMICWIVRTFPCCSIRDTVPDTRKNAKDEDIHSFSCQGPNLIVFAACTRHIRPNIPILFRIEKTLKHILRLRCKASKAHSPSVWRCRDEIFTHYSCVNWTAEMNLGRIHKSAKNCFDKFQS